MPDAYY